MSRRSDTILYLCGLWYIITTSQERRILRFCNINRCMIKIENYLGVIEIHQHYFSELIGQTVTSCFGVAGMANSGASQGLRSLLFKRKNYPDKGVGVCADGGDLIIDLHIIVTYGVNIGTIVDSITNKVRYTVEQSTGLGVKKVNVFVDGMKE